MKLEASLNSEHISTIVWFLRQKKSEQNALKKTQKTGLKNSDRWTNEILTKMLELDYMLDG